MSVKAALSTRTTVFFLLAIIITSLLVLLSLTTGPFKGVHIGDVIEYIIHGTGENTGIVRYRLHRTIAAMTVGIGLAVSGLSMQYSLRNPLADPFLLGVSSGAALGVVMVLVYFNRPHPILVYTVAMVLGLVSFFIVIGIGAKSGGSPSSIIVAGVSVSYALSGITIFIINKYLYKINITFMWLFGTVAYVTEKTLSITLLLVLAGTLFLLTLSDKIYTLVLGDDVSQSMGVNVKHIRYTTLLMSALTASATVALAGPVGFIGLAAPWLSRLLVGSRFNITLTMSILTGSTLALTSDIMIRLVSPSQEVPLTAFTALFGGPLLFYLTKKTGW